MAPTVVTVLVPHVPQDGPALRPPLPRVEPLLMSLGGLGDLQQVLCLRGPRLLQQGSCLCVRELQARPAHDGAQGVLGHGVPVVSHPSQILTVDLVNELLGDRWSHELVDVEQCLFPFPVFLHDVLYLQPDRQVLLQQCAEAATEVPNLVEGVVVAFLPLQQHEHTGGHGGHGSSALPRNGVGRDVAPARQHLPVPPDRAVPVLRRVPVDAHGVVRRVHP
mmetsp:Transcript_112353/g.350104  ORF Transcript_112353/g.350104 Transcript_112353/m.350104 type:complete len:220 (+) Transcript_112353:833-1492(+)